MTALDLMRSDEPYAIHYLDMPNHLQGAAQELCWRFNQLRPSDAEGRSRFFGSFWAPGIRVRRSSPSSGATTASTSTFAASRS